MEINTALLDTYSAAEHYDALYSAGYMERPDEQAVRILRTLFRSVDLPKSGIALDYGCGRGTYISLLREMLPGWEIHGADISLTALEIGKKKFPGIHFYAISTLEDKESYYDLVFSHHVLEHVQDINETFYLFSKICKPKSFLVHALPCGNPGSFEHAICQMRTDGIDHTHGNRFFYEDPTHLRRLTTDDMNKLAKRIGYSLVSERYMNHHYAAFDWLARSERKLRAEIFDPNKVKKLKDKVILIKYRVFTEFLAITKKISIIGKSPARRIHSKILKPLFRITLCPVADKLMSWFDKEVEKERQDAENRSGSAMFLVYSR